MLFVVLLFFFIFCTPSAVGYSALDFFLPLFVVIADGVGVDAGDVNFHAAEAAENCLNLSFLVEHFESFRFLLKSANATAKVVEI